MADSRGGRRASNGSRENAEVALLDWLNKSKQPIPKKRRDFVDFIYQHFERKEFPDSVVCSVYMKLKSFEKKIKECDTVILSSDEEKAQVTEILDFDAMESGQEPNVTLIQIPQVQVKTPEKKKREYHHHRSPNKVKVSLSNEDQSLLKKFKQQIILEELLKRDKEMLRIQQKKDKLQAAVQIEMGYAKKIQKERVEALAQEMLRLHKEGFRDGLSSDDLAQIVCLVEPQEFIPSESVITERLPSPDLGASGLSEELPSDDISIDMLYPAGEEQTSKGVKRRRRSSDPTKLKQVKKKQCWKSPDSSLECSSRRMRRDAEAELLRQHLFIDTLIELTIPDMVEEVNGVPRLKHNQPFCS